MTDPRPQEDVRESIERGGKVDGLKRGLKKVASWGKKAWKKIERGMKGLRRGRKAQIE